MSKKKAGGKTSQHIRPSGKRLGVKVATGEKVTTGTVLVRQSGKKMLPGSNVRVGRDYTLFSMVDGTAVFSKKLGRVIVSVTGSKKK